MTIIEYIVEIYIITAEQWVNKIKLVLIALGLKWASGYIQLDLTIII
jgi:hypothetical protein